MPSGRITKPVLLKTLMAIKIEYQAERSTPKSRLRKYGKNKAATIPSTLSEIPRASFTREPTSPRLLDFSPAAKSRVVSPMWRDTARESIEARVITPRPPIFIPSMMTSNPNPDQ